MLFLLSSYVDWLLDRSAILVIQHSSPLVQQLLLVTRYAIDVPLKFCRPPRKYMCCYFFHTICGHVFHRLINFLRIEKKTLVKMVLSLDFFPMENKLISRPLHKKDIVFIGHTIVLFLTLITNVAKNIELSYIRPKKYLRIYSFMFLAKIL